MKKIAILLFALIATASVSFAHNIDNWSTYNIQAVQEKVVTSDANGEVPGLYSTYSIDNKLIDYSSFDSNTHLEGLLAQLDQASQVDTTVAAATESANI
jgi:hypothetical protein